MNEDRATRLFSRAADSIPPIPRPPADQLIQQGKRVQRRQRLLRAGSVAAVAALIIGAGALWLPGSSGSAQPPIATNQTTAPNDSVPPTTPDDSNRAELPTAPYGTRWLGYQGVMVAIPTDWGTESGGCVDLPLHNTVFFEARQELTCAGIRPPGVSSLRIYDGDSEHIEGLLPELEQVPPLNGLNVRRKPTRMEGETEIAEGVLLVETANVLLWADSPDPAVVDAILDTAQLIPEGYTAVPDVSGMFNDSDIAPLMNEAELHWLPRCPRGGVCDISAVTATDPRAGSVVPVGTTVMAAVDRQSGGGETVLLLKAGEGGRDAIVTGPLTLVGTCVGIGDHVALWPQGTKIVDEFPLVLSVPGLGEVRAGETLAGAGGYFDTAVDDVSVDVPDSCGTSKVVDFRVEEYDSPRRPQLVQDEQAPVAPDLRRLIKMFVRYAVGDSDTFPHWESVSMVIGGQPVQSIDDISAALSNRQIWKICPADWDMYGASSCPVNLLGPITSAVVNDALLVYSAEYGNVVCAPTRSGPLPRGRLVVLRPTKESRSCASDFALVLAADKQGQLRSIDLTLSEP